MTTETETSLERQVREEQEQHDADAAHQLADLDENDPPASVSGDTEDPPVEPDGQVTAFSAADYDREDLQIAKIDGQSITKIALKFSGRVMLDRSDPADVALFNRAILGKELELRCAGRVSGTGAGYTTNKDGDLDVVVGEKTLKVETVWVLTPEDL